MQDIIKELEQRYQDEWEALKAHKPNLMIVGGSGVGKSSLINKIFGQKLAEVGTGKPVTESITLYTSPEALINIFDTMGYEPGKDSTTFDSVLQAIEDRKTKPLQEQIHIIWYCLSIPKSRIYDYDVSAIRSLKDSGTPLFIVFTRCDQDNVDEEGKRETAQAFKKILAEEYGLEDVRCFETAARGKDDFDLKELLEESCSSLSEEIFRKAFALAQMYDIKQKSRTAHAIIHSASLAAASAAATPLPGADAPVITGIQVVMCTALAKLYGVASSMGEASMSLLKAQLLSMLGKQLVRSLVKFIPILGSAINASVAAAFTEALGWGMVALYEKVLEDYLRTGKEPAWVEIFSSDILINFVKEKMAS